MAIIRSLYCGNCGEAVAENASYCPRCHVGLGRLGEGNSEHQASVTREYRERKRRRRKEEWEGFLAYYWWVSEDLRKLILFCILFGVPIALLLLIIFLPDDVMRPIFKWTSELFHGASKR